MPKVSIQNTKKNTFSQLVGQNRDKAKLAPPPSPLIQLQRIFYPITIRVKQIQFSENMPSSGSNLSRETTSVMQGELTYF